MEVGSLKKWLVLYVKGFAMGCADAVPGVSGGTIALIVGIYERLINAITSIGLEEFSRGLNGLRYTSISEIEELFLDMDGPFLLAVGLGIITAVVAVLRFAHYTISNYPILTYGFFFGLIAASALALYREIDFSSRWSLVAGFTGFLFAFLFSGYASTSLGNQLPVLFVAGMVSVSAMVLPGISGSLILVMLGQYEFMSAALSSFTNAIFSSLSSKTLIPVLETAPPVTVFIAGAFVGLFAVAHSVKKALKSHREATMAFLVSLILGALRAPIEEAGKAVSAESLTWTSVLPEFVSAAFVGSLVVLALHFYVDRQNIEENIS